MHWLKFSVALVATAAIAWSSVSDNPAVCTADAGEAGEHGQGAPAGSHCCTSCPCHTPTVVRPGASIVERAGPADAQVSSAIGALHSLDRPTPPTPPPNLLA